MKNDGFTLVELLAVIAIISILTVIAVPSALTFQNNMNKKMFCSKVETIETAAKLYGNDVKDSIEKEILIEADASLKCNSSLISSPCIKIPLKALLDKGYIKREANNTIGPDADGNYTYDQFYDPRTYTSMVTNEILVYVESKRVYTRYVYKNKADLELCNPLDATDPNKDLYYKSGSNIIKYTR